MDCIWFLKLWSKNNKYLYLQVSTFIIIQILGFESGPSIEVSEMADFWKNKISPVKPIYKKQLNIP